MLRHRLEQLWKLMKQIHRLSFFCHQPQRSRQPPIGGGCRWPPLFHGAQLAINTTMVSPAAEGYFTRGMLTPMGQRPWQHEGGSGCDTPGFPVLGRCWRAAGLVLWLCGCWSNGAGMAWMDLELGGTLHHLSAAHQGFCVCMSFQQWWFLILVDFSYCVPHKKKNLHWLMRSLAVFRADSSGFPSIRLHSSGSTSICSSSSGPGGLVVVLSPCVGGLST